MSTFMAYDFTMAAAGLASRKSLTQDSAMEQTAAPVTIGSSPGLGLG